MRDVLLPHLPDLFTALHINAPLLFYAIGFIAVTVTALSKAGFGGAIAIGIPMLLLVTTPRVALGITLPILLIVDVWVVTASYKKINYQLLTIMLIFGLLGHGIGWHYFDYISNAALTGFIGTMSLITVFLFFKRQWLPSKVTTTAGPPPAYRTWFRGAFWCTLSGISSFISVSGGVPLQVFLLGCKIDRTVYIGSAGAFFFALNLTKVPLYADLGILSAASFWVSMLLLPAIPLGVILARWVNNLLTDQQFYVAMHSILGLVGLQLLYKAFA
ncbi:MAG: sulfite exporter TauE/SafE family protein [Candidatus Puniceispirillum sp.]|jgi:uncharacterized membrane protein YfcA